MVRWCRSEGGIVIAVGRLHQVPATIEGEVTRMGSIGHDASQLGLMEHLSEVVPAADVLLGGGMQVLIMLVHAAGVGAVTNYVVHRAWRGRVDGASTCS
jgi:hypothetical protein